MFENVMNFFKKLSKKESTKESSDTAKERLHLVLMQDRANVSADFLELMRKEIIEVIKKYIDIDEEAIDVKLTNKPNEDGTVGSPALYANIPIITIKNEARKLAGFKEEEKAEPVKTAKKEEVKKQENKKAEIGENNPKEEAKKQDKAVKEEKEPKEEKTEKSKTATKQTAKKQVKSQSSKEKKTFKVETEAVKKAEKKQEETKQKQSKKQSEEKEKAQVNS